jgi:hypothetical protein
MSGTPEIARQNLKKGGRPKGSFASHTILAAKGKELLIKAYYENIQPINEALITKARAGDIQAIKELHDRVHGKAPQDMNIKGEVVSKIIALDE